MSETHFDKALRQQSLWPALHAASDVYRRRRAAGADDYELIWRLIHVCECLTITLAAAIVARVRELKRDEDYLKYRERLFGRSWSETDASLKRTSAALDGSIDKWIEILQLASSMNDPPPGFLAASQKFLGSDQEEDQQPGGEDTAYGISLTPLLQAWGRASDIPGSFEPNPCKVPQVLRAVNSFRNRFAHVPFPYDQLRQIRAALDECVHQIFSLGSGAANLGSPLSGGLGWKDQIFRGLGTDKLPSDWEEPDKIVFVWGDGRDECWGAEPFARFDQMMRPYLLTRLRNEDGTWEYTRYLAEANPIFVLTDPKLFDCLPRPQESDYETDDVGSAPSEKPSLSTDRVVSDRQSAMVALRSRDFVPAIEFFKKEVTDKPNYHSGWHRLGYAQREYGVDLMGTDETRARSCLQDSIKSFDRARGHVDGHFRNEAIYNRSKSNWRLFQLTGESCYQDSALTDAKDAATDYDSRFSSWLDFLRESAEPAPLSAL